MVDSTQGNHCAFPLCGQQDFLSTLCSDCNQFFCKLHRHVLCSNTLHNPEPMLIA